MDLNHGLAFSPPYENIRRRLPGLPNADIVVICAGVAQSRESRWTCSAHTGVPVHHRSGDGVGFNRIFLVATNPVDIMTRVTCALSGFNPRRVLGTSTAWIPPSAVSAGKNIFPVDPRNIHAYVMGEHGDSRVCSLVSGHAGYKPILSICEESGRPVLRRGYGKNHRGGAGAAQRSSPPRKPPITASAWRWCGSPGPSSATKAAC